VKTSTTLRETPNGGVGMALAPGKGVLVLVGCQTDFVSANEVFKDFTKRLADTALATGAPGMAAFLSRRENAVVAHDDVEQLGMVERIWARARQQATEAIPDGPAVMEAPSVWLVIAGATGAVKNAKLNMSSPTLAPFSSTGTALVLTMSRLSTT
jgi:hypothetical protein